MNFLCLLLQLGFISLSDMPNGAVSYGEIVDAAIKLVGIRTVLRYSIAIIHQLDISAKNDHTHMWHTHKRLMKVLADLFS